jgi:hypothetical protein
MPLVAPTNTATRRGGSEEAMREFDAWTAEWETILARESQPCVTKLCGLFEDCGLGVKVLKTGFDGV